MGGSDGDTQYKLSSEPPDTQICNGILFTSRRGQASYRFSLTQTMTFKKLFVWFLNKINQNIFFLILNLREHWSKNFKVISKKGGKLIDVPLAALVAE